MTCRVIPAIQRRFTLTASLIAWAKPVPALRSVRLAGLRGIDARMNLVAEEHTCLVGSGRACEWQAGRSTINAKARRRRMIRLVVCDRRINGLWHRSATFRRFRGAGRLYRPSSFMGIRTPRCIRATASMSSRSLRGPRTCRRKRIAVGYPEDIPILALSMPTRAAGSL
jgi:hypothetical protein